jgi:hypothetical protein
MHISSRPGMMPAISNEAVEISAKVAMRIASTLGGIIGSRHAPARMVPVYSRVL